MRRAQGLAITASVLLHLGGALLLWGPLSPQVPQRGGGPSPSPLQWVEMEEPQTPPPALATSPLASPHGRGKNARAEKNNRPLSPQAPGRPPPPKKESPKALPTVAPPLVALPPVAPSTTVALGPLGNPSPPEGMGEGAEGAALLPEGMGNGAEGAALSLQEGQGIGAPGRGGEGMASASMRRMEDRALQQRLQAKAQGCYPARAKRLRLRGTVRLSFCVDMQGMGTGEQLVQSSGHGLLDEAALLCVLKGAQPLPSSSQGRCFRVPIAFGGGL
ncbi:MAG: energy transducer TonB [Cystobacterineae bacterium]|nr:energy transducer TonB [Cystobacterineae bacterium]